MNDALLHLFFAGMGVGPHEECVGFGVSGELISCSTWIFETVPEKEPPWRRTEKPTQGISNYYQVVTELKVLGFGACLLELKLFAH